MTTLSPELRAVAEAGATDSVILIAHGSPDARHRESVGRLAARMTLLGDLGVSASFLEHDRPAAAEVLTPPVTDPPEPVVGCTVVLPLLLTAGFHWRSDIPPVVAHNGSRRVLLAPPAPVLFAAAVERLAGDRDHVVLASAGSSRPEVMGRFAELASALGSRSRRVEVALTTGAVAELAGPTTAVVPVLTADGIFADRIRRAARCAGARCTRVLGDTEDFAFALTVEVRAALDTGAHP